ncbi:MULTISPECIES: metal-dependent hydrolase [Clostridium]|uniref:Metal-dependent hydrolase n=1 Tax=Clostridium senegalense TaxID=1465809 RepID=A0A6M0H2U5_9CLOT|nr:MULTISPECIES: metal-dependent hydrolase [Clostridium]NEU04494.1 metal-dependent hydrolase [Clostridium senegalense]
MTGKTHLSVGVTTFMYFSDKLPGKYVLLSLLFTIIGSMFPDIDHPKSILNKYLLPFRNNTTKVVVYLFVGILIIYLDTTYKGSMIFKIMGISSILIALSPHRTGFTHSVFGALMTTFIVAAFSKAYDFKNLQYYFMLGYIGHLICDMCTRKGVPLLYPIKNNKFKFPMAYSSSSKRGKFIENIIILSSIIYSTLKLPTLF